MTGLQAGADDYLTKPVIEPELIARLNTGKRIVTLERSLRAANEENRRLSITDPLTGAYNRRYLMEQLPREIDRAARYGRELVRGHVRRRSFQEDQRHPRTPRRRRSAEVVRQRACRRRVRARDWVARYGGEEFVVVLPETNVANARSPPRICEQRIASSAARSWCQPSLPVTASFGVSGWQGHRPQGATLDALHRDVRCRRLCQQGRRTQSRDDGSRWTDARRLLAYVGSAATLVRSSAGAVFPAEPRRRSAQHRRVPAAAFLIRLSAPARGHLRLQELRGALEFQIDSQHQFLQARLIDDPACVSSS